MAKVLCADCGHREEMPRAVAKLALESRQDPKCPSCRSARLTVDDRGGRKAFAARRRLAYAYNSAGEITDWGRDEAPYGGEVAYDDRAGEWSEAAAERDESELRSRFSGPFMEQIGRWLSGEPGWGSWSAPKAAEQMFEDFLSSYDEGNWEWWEGDPYLFVEDWLGRNLVSGDGRTARRRRTPRRSVVSVDAMEDSQDPDVWWDHYRLKEQEDYDMSINEPDFEIRGWEFSDEKDSAYGEYVRDFLGDDGELDERDDLSVQGRRRVASGSWVSANQINEGDLVDLETLRFPRALGDESNPASTWDMARYEYGRVMEVVPDAVGDGRVGLEIDLGQGSESVLVPGGASIYRVGRRTGRRKVAYGVGTPKVWIASLSDYNNGKLVGKWVDATDVGSLEDGIDEVLAMSDFPNAEEWSIHDYDNFGGVSLGENPSLEEVAALGALIEREGEVAIAAIEALGMPDPDYVSSMIDDGYQGQFSSDEDFAMALVDSIGFSGLSNPEYYFDYERWGRDVAMEWSWHEDEDDPDPSLEALRNDYYGDHREWAEDMIYGMGGVDQLDEETRESYINWDSLTRDLMMDYYESRGHYFRAI